MIDDEIKHQENATRTPRAISFDRYYRYDEVSETLNEKKKTVYMSVYIMHFTENHVILPTYMNILHPRTVSRFYHLMDENTALFSV